MTRTPWDDIHIRETEQGPEIVCTTSGVGGCIIPFTDADLDELEDVLTERRHAREAKAEVAVLSAFLTPFVQCRAEGHDWPSDQPGSTLQADDLETCSRCKTSRHVTEAR